MEIEKIGNVGSNVETVKVSQPKHVEPVQVEAMKPEVKAAAKVYVRVKLQAKLVAKRLAEQVASKAKEVKVKSKV